MTPRDVCCEGFSLTYPRIAESSSALSAGVDQKVDDAIESFLRTLSQIGPELLSGCLTLSFFERRATRQLFGLVSHEERVVYVYVQSLVRVFASFFLGGCCSYYWINYVFLAGGNNGFYG